MGMLRYPPCYGKAFPSRRPKVPGGPWFTMVQARLGFSPWNNILIYGKLGIGWEGVDVTGTINQSIGYTIGTGSTARMGTLAFNQLGSSSGTASGFAWGGGLEYGIAGTGWSFKLEYDEIDAGGVDTPLIGGVSGSRNGFFNPAHQYSGIFAPTAPGNIHLDETNRMILFGINYKVSSLFGG